MAEGPYADHQAWEQAFVRPGVKGLVLPPKNNLDGIGVDALLRMKNLMQRMPGPLTVRVGQEGFITLPAAVHSAFRADDPSTGTILRLWGASTIAYKGNSLAGAPIATGLSGRPLTAVAFYTQISDDPWLIVADGNRMFKVRVSDGLVLPLGLAAPAAPTAAISDLLTTLFAAFDSSDNTQAANWTATAGYDQSEVPILAGVPTLADAAGVSGNSVVMTTVIGGAQKAYSSIGGVPITVNANVLQAGAFPASDDDLVHLWLRTNRPDLVSEIRLYLVCSAGFVPSVIPGTSTTQNQDAYVKAFRPSDWTDYVERQAAAVDAGQVIRDNTMVDTYADDITPDDPRDIGPGDFIAANQASRQTSVAMQAGRGVWSEMGVVGNPVRRGDWSRLGTTANRDWGTLTGLVLVVITNTNQAVEVAVDDFHLSGGFGPDTSDPGASAMTYKVTNYDPRTGAESNGSAESADVNPARNRVTINPPAHADGAMRQRAYRRGGTINDDWHEVGESTANGGQIVDTLNAEEVSEAPTVPTDHDQPVSTVNSSGTTVLAQAVPIIFGPIDDMMLACGDPYRPGTLYTCIPGEIDHWPSDLAEPVCPASEELMNGCMWGGAGWVFSRKRLYSVYVNLVSGEGQSIRTNPTSCTPGMAAKYGLCVTPRGIAYVASDGVRLTQGGGSTLLSDNIQPIFDPAGTTIQSVAAIDWTSPNSIRLTYHDERLWFIYKGLDGVFYCFTYDFLGEQWQGPHVFCDDARTFNVEETDPTHPGRLVIGGAAAGSFWQGTSDINTSGVASPIAFVAKSGAWDLNLPAATKSLGDVQFDVDLPVDTQMVVTTRLNNETVANIAQAVTAGSGRLRYIFNPFGTTPQQARNVTIEIAANVLEAGSIYLQGLSYIPQPLTTTIRPTPWTVLTPQGYVVGCEILADTGGAAIEVTAEYDDGTSNIAGAKTFTINCNGRRKIFESWQGVLARQVRIRPSTECGAWICFDVKWMYSVEPPTTVVWNNDGDNLGDVYYTGVDFECDTFGLTKVVEVFVDEVSIGSFNVLASGRQLVHVTFPLALTGNYGHLFRFIATDDNPGQLYGHRWLVEDAPGEQTNWNQPFSTYGTNADKYLKALVIHCDTFGQDTTVQIEADGVITGSIVVNANGPKVVMKSFAPILGRVFRTQTISAVPGRCWEIEPIFDEEPLALDRWQTQRIDHGQSGWHTLVRAFPCLRSTAVTQLRITSYNQIGQVVQNQFYNIPSTGGAKVKPWVPFVAAKGVLYEWLFTSVDSSPLYLYREESRVWLQPWGGGPEVEVRPFGTDDMDLVRQRTHGPNVGETKPTPWVPPITSLPRS